MSHSLSEENQKEGPIPTIFEWLQGLFIVHCTIDITAHSKPLNCLVHCICTTPITNIRHDRNSSPVPLSFEPQPVRMSHRVGPPGVWLLCVCVSCGMPYVGHPSHTTRSPNAVLMLGRRRRRRTSIKTALGQRMRTQCAGAIPSWCWASIEGDGPTLSQHW